MADSGATVHVGGDVRGQIVVGDNNVTVWAEQSVVTVLPGPRPQPVRRDAVSLLPRRSTSPIGRERDVRAVRSAVEAERLVQVYGAAGTGKSTLLRHVCGTGAPGGTVFLSGAGQDVSDLLQDVFEACYDTAGYRPGAVELRRLMADVDIRLWIDDLDVDDEARETLLDGVPAAAVVFTSEARAAWSNGRSLALEGLDVESGLALLARSLDRPLTDAERVEATELWRLCAGSPMMLVRVAAAARSVAGGWVLPRPAELAVLVPRLVTALDPAGLDLAAVLALAGPAGLSVDLLPRLVADPALLPEGLAGCGSSGLVLDTGGRLLLAPGAAAALPAEDPARVTRVAGALREWVAAPGTSPREVAAHELLIAAVVDATVTAGLPALGAKLAKAAAPATACSLRLGAWGRILACGKAAAERAGDRSILAYFVHEDGVRKLVTGKRVAAAAAIGAALVLWHELGATAHVALAQHTQALAAHAVAHAGATTVHATSQVVAGHAVASGGHAVAITAKTAGIGAKAGIGLTAKLAAAGVATVVVGGGGYLAVAALQSSPPPTPAVAVAPPPPAQLTSAQLAQALQPGAGFPDGYHVVPCQATCRATPPAAAQPPDLATMTCTDPMTPQRPLFAFRFDADGFPAGFGETAFASDEEVAAGGTAFPVEGVDDNLIFDQAIYQFATPARAQAFFDGVRKVMTSCVDETGKTVGAGAAAVDGRPAIIADPITLLRPTAGGSVDFYSTMAPYYVLDGTHVYALAPGAGRNIGPGALPTMVPTLPSVAGKMLASVATLMAHAGTSPSSPAPSPSPAAVSKQPTAPGTSPESVVTAYVDAINAKDYQRAWDLGGKSFGQTFTAFKGGFTGTDHDTLMIRAVHGGDVTVDLVAVHTDGARHTFHGVYTVTAGVITAHSIHQTG